MLESIIAFSVAQNASDLHLSSDEKPLMRKNGQLVPINQVIVTAKQLEQYLMSLLSDKQYRELEQQRQLDFAYFHQRLGRFRINIFFQYRGISAVWRIIRPEPLTLDVIKAPPVLTKMVMKTEGLVLITGTTGCGKSTTITALINYLNQYTNKHIITLEDPIEFIYSNRQCLIQQREIGVHCHSFGDGLHSILRQDPDIIVIGELRSQSTIQAALTAAETGHLVLATLHTYNAIQAIERIIDLFSHTSQSVIRTQLANVLLCVSAQKLIFDINISSYAEFEVLVNIPSVSNLIQEGKTKQLFSIMQTGQQQGMQVFN